MENLIINQTQLNELTKVLNEMEWYCEGTMASNNEFTMAETIVEELNDHNFSPEEIQFLIEENAIDIEELVDEHGLNYEAIIDLLSDDIARILTPWNWVDTLSRITFKATVSNF